MSRVAALSVLLLVAASGIQPRSVAAEIVAPRYPSDRITLEQWRAYLTEVKAVPDVKCIDYVQDQYVCDSSMQRTIWVFTREGHPAHPAVSRGILRQTPDSGFLGIDRSGHHAGDQTAFYRWMMDFVDLDRKQISEISRTPPLR